MGEASNQLAGPQGSRTGPVERYKSTGMGSPCYLAWGVRVQKSQPSCKASLGGTEGTLKHLQTMDTTTIAVRDLLPKQSAPPPCLGDWGAQGSRSIEQKMPRGGRQRITG